MLKTRYNKTKNEKKITTTRKAETNEQKQKKEN